VSIPITNIHALLDGYRHHRYSPEQVVDETLERIENNGDDRVWITRLDRESILEQVNKLPASPLADDLATYPLYGVPFAVKDNIDVQGLPTTAGCAAFAYVAEATAPVVERLLKAGAILFGKTNMTQFALGLAGERAPYGIPRNRFAAEYITGGSSSGSAVAMADRLLSFTLGTDTAGSGRLPAALNNVVGLKPSIGLLSIRGVVPACLSLDCVSIFAEDTRSAEIVFDVVCAPDVLDPYSRDMRETKSAPIRRVGILAEKDREFFGDTDSAAVYAAAIERLLDLGIVCSEIDYAPFRETAAMLYNGPWMAERDVAVGEFIRKNPDAVVPITRDSILGSSKITAADAFRSFQRLKELQRQTRATWASNDAILLPTSPTTYKIADVMKDPFGILHRLSLYTNFVNLLDLSAITLPSGFTGEGLPVGLTLIGPAFTDKSLLALAHDYMDRTLQERESGPRAVSELRTA
jgi:allophanate hydrolase